MHAKQLVWQIVTLGTPQGRVLAWLAATTIVFIVPFSWLSNLSLWQRLGFDWAPSIGLTRAYWLLIHGHPAAALDRNFLIVPVCVVGLVVIAGDIYRIKQSTILGKKSYTNDIQT
ncbi:MAG TPA: DUF2752 domain-containing protein [Verrucomicrobiae bacterium]|nr:DUF2752 domain-containing protein [Verrucomicrobiae bacterium]